MLGKKKALDGLTFLLILIKKLENLTEEEHQIHKLIVKICRILRKIILILIRCLIKHDDLDWYEEGEGIGVGL